jgi:hypothetical protein
LFAKIKAELEGGMIDQLLAEREETEDYMDRDEAAMMGRVMHDVKRPFDGLLREFGW